MRSFDELLKESASIHGHLCAGQVLGVRMAMAGCREAGIDEPKGCKKLVVYVEIDRCATDAIQAVTGCSLGKRSLKFLDYGKMAATFVNTETQKAVRVVARDDARALAASYVTDAANRHEAEKQAYALMPEESLFSLVAVEIEIPPTERPGSRSERVSCARCGEGINFQREVRKDGKIFCIPCARGSYLPQLKKAASEERPKLLFIGGPSNGGKTTLIEKLVPEIAARGYRVGTVKHHHNGAPLVFDGEGKDSWRHRQAGAAAVSLVSGHEIVSFRRVQGAPGIDAIRSDFRDVDIVLVEGFNGEPGVRIEVRGANGAGREDGETNGAPLAVIEREKSNGCPSYKPDDIGPLADLIVREVFG